jgi:hypothetical protein
VRWPRSGDSSRFGLPQACEQGADLGFPEPAMTPKCADGGQLACLRPPGDSLRVDSEHPRDFSWCEQQFGGGHWCAHMRFSPRMMGHPTMTQSDYDITTSDEWAILGKSAQDRGLSRQVESAEHAAGDALRLWPVGRNEACRGEGGLPDIDGSRCEAVTFSSFIAPHLRRHRRRVWDGPPGGRFGDQVASNVIAAATCRSESCASSAGGRARA